jgi:hypothetical protein
MDVLQPDPAALRASTLPEDGEGSPHFLTYFITRLGPTSAP